MRTINMILALGILTWGITSTPINAATIVWTGNHSNQWNHVENWNPQIVPNNGDDVIIPNTWSSEIIVDGANASCKSLSYNGSGFGLKINGEWELITSGNINISGNSNIHGLGGIEIIGNNDCYLNYSDSTIVNVNHINVKSNANVFLTRSLIMPMGKLNVFSGNFYAMGNEINVNTLTMVLGTATRSINIDNSTVTAIVTNLFVLNGGSFSSVNSIFNNKLLIQTDGNVSFNIINADDRATITTVQNNAHVTITELNANGSINIVGGDYYSAQSFTVVNFNILQSSSIIKLSASPIAAGYYFVTIHTPTGCQGDILFTDESEVRGNQVLFNIIGGINLNKASCANIKVVSGSLTIQNGMDIGNNSGITFIQSTPIAYYWINGAGNWNDPNHWSLTSGGAAAGCIPGLNDHVTFNNASGFSSNDTVKITNHTFCNNLIADQSLINKPIFASSNNTDLTLNVAGDMDLRGFSKYMVIFQILFRNKSNNKIYSGNHTLLGNVYFTNKGTSELKSDLNCYNGTKSIIQMLGHIKTNGFKINTSSIISKGIKQPSTPRALTLGNSKIYAGNPTLASGNVIVVADSLLLDAGTSEFIFCYLSNQSSQIKIDGTGNLRFYNASFLNLVGNQQLVFNHQSSFNKVHFYGNGKIFGANLNITTDMSSIDTLIITGKYKYELEENTRININKKLITEHGICNEMSMLSSTSLANKAFIHSSTPTALTLENIWIENIEASGMSLPMIVTNGVNGGNNLHFNFTSINQSQTFFWNGEANNSNWSNGGNWNIGVQPHPATNNDLFLYNLNGCIPGFNDSVVFHVNSFPLVDTVTINESVNFKGMMWMPGTGTNRHMAGPSEFVLNNYGGLEFDNNLQLDYTGDIIFRSPNIRQIYFRGVPYQGGITFYNLGKYILKDELTCAGYVVKFLAGSFVSEGNTINTNRIWILHENAPANNNNSLDFGNSNININISFVGNFFNNRSVLNADQSQINYYGAGSSMTVTGDHSNLEFGKVYFHSTVGNVALISNYYNGISMPHYQLVDFAPSALIQGENSIDTLILAEGREYQLESNTTQYINDLLYSKGSPCFRTTITSTQPGTRAYIKNQNCNLLVEHARIRDIEGILGTCGANNYLVGVGGEDMGNNLNWNFIPGNPINGLGLDTTLTCSTLPYLQTTLGFGRYESIVWDNGSTNHHLVIDSICTISATVTYSPTCIVTDTRAFQFNDMITQAGIVNNITCFGSNNGSIELNISDVDTVYNQKWVYPDLQIRNSTRSINNLHPGTYTSIVTIPGYESMCSDTIQFTINEPGLLTVELDTTITGKCSDPDGNILITAKGGTGELIYQWSDGSTDEDNYTVDGGPNSVVVSDTNGCFATLSIEMDCIDHLNIPELLTPNDDGYSDNWEIIDLYRLYPNNDVKILNRWGNTVYHKQGYNNEFTGLSNTNDTLSKGYLPAGTYFYVIDLGKGYKTLTGYIELIY